MSQTLELNRRAFLRNAGLTAVAGAVGTGSIAASAPVAAAPPKPHHGKYDLDTIYNRIGSDCYKWDKQIEKFGRENITVPMGIADMDFKCAPQITQAILRRVEHENYGYIYMPDSYAESIINWNRARYGIEIQPEGLVNANGVNPAILSALRAFSPPTSKVLLLPPTYSSFYSTVKKAGCVAEECPLHYENGEYSIDFEDFERRIDSGVTSFIFCNPQNPTGNCWSLADMQALGEICARKGVVVLSDEIHCDFVNTGHRYTPFSTIPDESIVRNSVTFKSTSKSFNLAATKCAYFFSDNADYIARIKATGHNTAVNSLAVAASEAAYNEAGDWLDEVVSYVDQNMEHASQFINKRISHVKFYKPEGTYLAWLDVSELAEKIGAREMAERANRKLAPGETALEPENMIELYIVENAGVQLNDGFRYGVGGNNRMRMNLATSRHLVSQALENMAVALDRV